MKFLDYTGARHFCRPGGLAAAPAIPKPSLREYYRGLSSRPSVINEGTPVFEAHRVLAQHDAERYLFMAASQYRRSIDLLAANAAAWTHVSLYYGAFFAANALTLMFGALIDGNKMTIEAAKSNPGNISLAGTYGGKKPLTTPNNYQGPHRAFWDFFYSGAKDLIPWVDSSLQFALRPVSSSVTWQIDQRNDVNYDPFVALESVARFLGSFDPLHCRPSLGGPLATQLNVSEALLFVACRFAADFGLASGSLAALTQTGSRVDSIRQLILGGGHQDMTPQFDLAKLTV